MKYIHQYVKGQGSRKDNKVGVLLAVKEGNTVTITGSKANLSAGDTFDSETALNLAWDRQAARNRDPKRQRRITIPHSMRRDLDKFVDRSRRYFKDAERFDIPEIDAPSDIMVSLLED